MSSFWGTFSAWKGETATTSPQVSSRSTEGKVSAVLILWGGLSGLWALLPTGGSKILAKTQGHKDWRPGEKVICSCSGKWSGERPVIFFPFSLQKQEQSSDLCRVPPGSPLPAAFTSVTKQGDWYPAFGLGSDIFFILLDRIFHLCSQCCVPDYI